MLDLRCHRFLPTGTEVMFLNVLPLADMQAQLD